MFSSSVHGSSFDLRLSRLEQNLFKPNESTHKGPLQHVKVFSLYLEGGLNFMCAAIKSSCDQ